MTDLFKSEPNKEGTWAVVDETGKVLETFRLRGTAVENINKWKNSYYFGVKVINLNDGRVVK